jgi:hypothetical protein
MSNVIRLPLLAPNIRDDAGAREVERGAGGLIKLLLRLTRASVRTATASHFESPPRLEWNHADRRLIAAANALLGDRPPRGHDLSPDDTKALRVAIALRTLHPGGRAPTPWYVDDLARRLRILRQAIRDDPPAREFDEPNRRGSSYRSEHGQLRDRAG